MSAQPHVAVPPTAQEQQQTGPNPQQQLLQAAMGYVVSSAVYTATKLGIADLLADGPKPVAELAKQTQTHEDALYRMLRALACAGIFAEVEAGSRLFALTPPAEFLLSGREGSMREFLLFFPDPFHFHLYAEMLYSIKTGKPAVEHVHGMPVFELFADPKYKEESVVFNAAMTSFSAVVVPAVLEVYDFSGIGTLMDVAGGHGFVLTSILKKYPEMRGKLVDLEHVTKGARQRIAELKLTDRCEVVTGDFFQSVPEGADAIIMKHIIHDWDDEKALLILKNCRKALGKNGKLILLEAVISEDNEPHPGKFVDLEMLIFPGGRERTESEYRKLFEEAGFKMNRVVPNKSPLSVVEAVSQ
ncbi:MAG: methyltransferase [Acidobacteriales bacterium]|nr:methyltransferase [Terriglobales bacterium]